ncbi:uncharacterized protein LOC126812596 [Patella vulgata]|uniref:uncharacterized protein LOC126812596 n=1 Tax=Patella vulgata TaxID=6465 RepID=UPI0021803E3C|nr:uncharacterized protein LOC126812596 [Patella vulgata]
MVPEPSTFSQMAYEMGVLSDIQVAEEMTSNDNLTLSMDATSLDGDHINEVHVNLPSTPPRGLILQIAVLGGGATGDYLEHIKESINDVTLSYAKCFQKDHMELKERVISHLKNTITDPVAVNHCVVEQLIKDFDIAILELNCTLHPVDGIASRARSVLKECDAKFKIVSSTFGQACKAANLIYGVSKMRYKQGKGDPGAFKLFIKSHNIRSAQFVRFGICVQFPKF